MDFYALLKPEIESACGGLAKEFSDAKRKLALLLKRQDDTKSLLVRLQERKRELTGLGDESVAEDVNSFEKFKVSLKKITAEATATSEALSVLTDKIIPDARKEGLESERALKTGLLEFWKPHRRTCEKEMRELLDQIIRLQDGFEYAFIRTADDFGLRGADFLGMSSIYGSIIPLPSHLRFDTIRIVGPPESAMRAPTVAVEAPVTELISTQDGQTTPEMPVTTPEAVLQAPEPPVLPEIMPAEAQDVAEGSLILLEAALQAPEPHSPPGDGVGTTPKTVLMGTVV